VAHHLLESNPNTIHWGHLDAAIAPKLIVNSGDLVVIDTLSGGRGDLGGDLSLCKSKPSADY
jgi:hypothetical protein